MKLQTEFFTETLMQAQNLDGSLLILTSRLVLASSQPAESASQVYLCMNVFSEAAGSFFNLFVYGAFGSGWAEF